jgi:hypothetical protein
MRYIILILAMTITFWAIPVNQTMCHDVKKVVGMREHDCSSNSCVYEPLYETVQVCGD